VYIYCQNLSLQLYFLYPYYNTFFKKYLSINYGNIFGKFCIKLTALIFLSVYVFL